MKSPKVIPILVFFVLVLSILACAGGTRLNPTPVPPTSTQASEQVSHKATPAPKSTKAPETKPTEPQPTKGPEQPATGELAIKNTSSYKDSSGTFHVVGEVYNGGKKDLTSIELTISIKDASGNSLLKDSDGKVIETNTFSPMLYTLAPGESSPFEYYLGSDAGSPDKYEVTLTGQLTGETHRAEVEVRNTEFVNDGNGTFYLSGEIANKSSKPVTIHSLAGAVLDKDKKVVSADWTGTYAGTLLPAGDAKGLDVTPFIIGIDNPGDAADSWATYIDADEDTLDKAFALDISIATSYFDSMGNYHIVGMVTNKTEEVVHTGVVAGLYDDKGAVLDASNGSMPTGILPGESLPYDAQYFSSVDYSQDQAGKLKTNTVQTDVYGTYAYFYKTEELKSEGQTVDKSGSSWTVKGNVTNTSKAALSSATVIVAVYDSKGNLVASDWTSVYPKGDSIAPGDTNSYEIYLDLDPKLDTTGLTIKTIVRGDVKS